MKVAARLGSIALAALLLGSAARANPGWREMKRSEDPRSGFVLYESRSEQARYQSYRVETRFDVGPEQAAEALVQVMTSDHHVPDGQRRRVLSHSADEILIYTFIDMPMVMSDRDIALRLKLHRDDSTGVRRIDWADANDAAPTAPSEVVRMPAVSGYWEFVPDGPGRCLATYVTHADLGGSVPAWLVSPMMRRQVGGDVDRLRRFIADRSTAVAAPPPSRGGR